VVPGLGANDANTLQILETTVHQAARPGAEAERAACCQAMAAALTGEAALEAKLWLLHQMITIGRGEVVPLLTKLLDDGEPLLREAARRALQHNPVPEAAASLRAALVRTTDPARQSALILALGARQDAASVPQIAHLLARRDARLMEAACYALGNIANAAAAKALAEVRPSVPGPFRLSAAEAEFKCAEQLLKAGRTAEAAAIYRAWQQPSEPRSTRLAALQGTLRAAGDNAGNMVLGILAGDDADARAVALGHVPNLAGGASRTLVTGIGKLPSSTQTLLLEMLADQGEKAALPLALDFARSQDETLRLAGLRALGPLGDASTVPVLVGALAAEGEMATTARSSLGRLTGPGIDDRLVTAMRSEIDPARRGNLVDVLEARGAVAAVPALLQEVTGDTADLRRRAMRTLGKLASPADVPAMLRGLLKATAGSERGDAEKAVAQVCSRIPEADLQSAPVIAAYQQAGATDRLALLPLLGRIGGSKALGIVKTALASEDASLSKAGLDALSNWPDESAEDELLSLARKTEKPADRSVALRAYIRVIALPSGLPDKVRLQKFQNAMSLAGRDQERNLVLDRLTEVRHIEAFRFAAGHLDNPALAQRAGNTLVELARHGGVRDRNKDEVDLALKKVIATSKDTGLVDKAKARLEGR